MVVTKEAQGRLNAFAKEPEIEVVSKESSSSKGTRLFLIFGIVLFVALIAFSFTIN